MGNSATLWTERESSSSFQGQAGGLGWGRNQQERRWGSRGSPQTPGPVCASFLEKLVNSTNCELEQVTARSCVHWWRLHTKNSSHRAWGMCVNRAPVPRRTGLHYTCGFGGNIGWNRGPASHQLCSSELWVRLGPEQQQVGPCGFQFILWCPSGSWESGSGVKQGDCQEVLWAGQTVTVSSGTEAWRERPKSWAVRTK